jgi:hypothetical protein
MAAGGRFIPKNPGKYLGDPNKIIFRSSWELSVCKFFDNHPSVYKWGSEEISIPYVKPTDGRVHKYFPDFIVVYKDKEGNLIKELVEVKPLKESVLTERSSNYDKLAIAVNHAKWQAAEAFCTANNMKFRVLTEQSIFAGGKKANNKTKKTKSNNSTVGTTTRRKLSK